jgi:hypothetical protein
VPSAGTCSNVTTDARVAAKTTARGAASRVSAATIAACAGVAALALVSPSLGAGWVADDWLQELMLRPDPGVNGIEHAPLDLFSFARADAEQARHLMDEGVFPWWADPRAALAFFRPLASLSHWLDHALWPGDARWAHLHSILWFAGLLAVVHALYRRFAPSPFAAAAAFVLFALDDAHAPTVGWIANRNLSMALTLSLPALLLHDAHRRGRSRWGHCLAAALLALGLCAGEGALVTLCYLTAYALWLERGPLRARLISLAPYLALCAIWRALYVTFGYGARHSGLYVDPLANPLDFLVAVGERLPVLALSQLALPWADLWEVYPLVAPAARAFVYCAALLVMIAFCSSLRTLLRERPDLRFWLAGAAASALPMCATFPHDRLLLGVGIGVMPAVAALLARAWQRRRSKGARLALVCIGGLHLVLAPALLAVRSIHAGDLRQRLARADQTLHGDAPLAGRTLIVLNPPLDPFAAYLPLYREAERRPRPASLLWLATAVTPLEVTTVDAHSLRLRPRNGFLTSSTQLMLRRPRDAFKVGDRVELGAATFQVQRVSDDGRPAEVLVTFRLPLSSPELLWTQWRDDEYATFSPPPLGATVELPAADFAQLLFGG